MASSGAGTGVSTSRRSWFYYLAYRIENHYLFQLSLRDWLWVLLVTPPVAAYFGLLSWLWAAIASVVAVLLLVGTFVARRNGYFVFEPAPLGAAAPDSLAAPQERLPALQVDEAVACWGYGHFAVEGRERTLIHESARYFYVRTREHVVMAMVKETRFLLLAQSSRKEAGCWYVFFMPDQVEAVVEGRLSCGGTARPALAIHYRPEEQPDRAQVVYVAFADVGAAKRVSADLCLDVPAEAWTWGNQA